MATGACRFFGFSANQNLAGSRGGTVAVLLLLVVALAPTLRGQDSNSNLDGQRARSLYNQGQYAELGDYLNTYLKQNSSDPKARTMLAMVFLRLNERDKAMQEIAVLRQAGEPSKKYVAQIEQLLSDLQKQDQAKEGLRKALNNYDVKGATEAVSVLSASPVQSGIIYAYLNAYQGKFEDARVSLTKINTDRLTDQQSIKSVVSQIQDAQKKHDERLKRIDTYLYSENTSNACNSFLMNEKQSRNGKYPFVSARDLQQYVGDVVDLATTSPLEPLVMDLAFHAALMGQDYAAVERLGDQILRGKGRLSIPFLSQDNFLYFTIDATRKRMLTEPDKTHTLQVYYDYPALVATDYTPLVMFHAGGAKKHAKQARWYEKEARFDLSFDEITTLSQKGKDWRGGLSAKSFAVKFAPNAIAPNYLLMNVLACVYGEEAQRNATRNLGQFIVHVLQPRKVQADLVDPSKHTFDIWGDGRLLSTMAGVYGSAAQNAGNAQAMQNATILGTIAANEEQKATQLKQEQNVGRQVWYQSMETAAFAASSNRAFAGIEELVGLI